MTNLEVLTACLTIAINNGWDDMGAGAEKIAKDLDGDCNCYGSFSDIFFDHSFAKALFGGGDVPDFVSPYSDDDFTLIEAWKYHLQQLVISEDFIDYLRKWLEAQK